MNKFEPYKTDSLLKLMQYAHNLGRYSGTKVLFSIQCFGSFEGFYGRATESWEHKYIIKSDEVELDNKKVIPAVHTEGRTLEEACSKALIALNIQ